MVIIIVTFIRCGSSHEMEMEWYSLPPYNAFCYFRGEGKVTIWGVHYHQVMVIA